MHVAKNNWLFSSSASKQAKMDIIVNEWFESSWNK